MNQFTVVKIQFLSFLSAWIDSLPYNIRMNQFIAVENQFFYSFFKFKTCFKTSHSILIHYNIMEQLLNQNFNMVNQIWNMQKVPYSNIEISILINHVDKLIITHTWQNHVQTFVHVQLDKLYKVCKNWKPIHHYSIHKLMQRAEPRECYKEIKIKMTNMIFQRWLNY
jgi:hypothetical protein